MAHVNFADPRLRRTGQSLWFSPPLGRCVAGLQRGVMQSSEFANEPYSSLKKAPTINPAARQRVRRGSVPAKGGGVELRKMWLRTVCGWRLAGMGFLPRADWKRLWPTLLLATPIPFYARSWHTAGAYLSHLWPFAYYNVRYGFSRCRRWWCLEHWDCYHMEMVKSAQSLQQNPQTDDPVGSFCDAGAGTAATSESAGANRFVTAKLAINSPRRRHSRNKSRFG